MPMTVNGIGTHYYGKRNVSVRTAACTSCHRVGALESYDTRLWFVIVFIPVIPLGRKRIIDECPACRRHFVASADSYEQTKQLQTSGALEHYHREPSPETALVVHGHLLAFHEHSQAADFRAIALQKFRRHAGLRGGMADQLRQASSFQEADRLFQEAYDLSPDDPMARTGVALQKMGQGDFDGARNLLDFLEEPGAGQHHSLGPLDILAGYYQRAGRHDEALQLSAVLLRELPNLGNQYQFRAFVRKSEKALGGRESILPPRGGTILGLFRSKDSPYAPWQRTIAIGGVVLLLVAVGLALNNEYIRRHRTLHVVNACAAPVQVQVDDEPAVSVGGFSKLTVSEGPHKIKVSGPVEETHDVILSASYLDRWFRNPVWVLNPGGEAVLQEVQHIYSAPPRPGRQQMIVGQSFFAKPNYDYVFERAPSSISISSKNAEMVKTELNWVQGQDVEAFYSALSTDRVVALKFAQRRLKRHPEPKGLFKAYLSSATEEELPQIRAYLRSGLDARPVNVSWHRAYQTISEGDTPETELLALYDRFLAAEPTDATLMYLRGRIEPDDSKQTAYYRRAIDADPKLAWPWVGLAAQAEAWARWQEAGAAVRKAKELPLEDTDLLDELAHIARLGAGEAEALVQEYRARLDANTLDPIGLLYLLEALVVAGKADEVDAAFAAWQGRLPAEVQVQVGPHLRVFAHYLTGKVEACLALCAEVTALQDTPVRAYALMALGKARPASEDLGFVKVWDDPWNALALSVAFSLDAQAKDAARWRDRAGEKLRQHHVAAILNAPQAPSLESLSVLHLRVSDKALLLTALAARFPVRQDEYLGLAAKLNVRRLPPYLLVRRAVERKFVPTP